MNPAEAEPSSRDAPPPISANSPEARAPADGTVSHMAIRPLIESGTALGDLLNALRARIESDLKPRKTRAAGVWHALNSPFVIFLFSSVFVAIISSLWAERTRANEQAVAQLRLQHESSTEIRYRDAFLSSFLARDISPTDVDLMEQFFLGRGRDFAPALRAFDGASFFGVVSSRDGYAEKRLSNIACPDSIVAFQKALRIAKETPIGVQVLPESAAAPLRSTWHQVRTDCVIVSREQETWK